MRITCLLLAAAALIPLRAPAAELFPPEKQARILAGLRDIYNLDHDRAAAAFERLIAESPDDPAGYAYLATTLWRKELSGQQESSIDRFASSDFFSDEARPVGPVEPSLEARFRRLSQDAIDRAKRRLAGRPGDLSSLYLLALTYQNLASFEASLKRNWWAAFRDGSRCYAYNRELLRRAPGLHDAHLATGVYTYAAGSLGWSVRWLSLLMGYRGSRERGKQELEAAARLGQLAADDARVILVLIYTRERDFQRAYDQLSDLRNRYPRNYLFQLEMAGMALHRNDPGRAIEIYHDVLRRREAAEANYQKLEAGFLYNRLGVAWRARGDLPRSVDSFRRALALPSPSSHTLSLAHLELGKSLAALGRRDEALAAFRQAAALPDFAGSRDEARRLLSELTKR